MCLLAICIFSLGKSIQVFCLYFNIGFHWIVRILNILCVNIWFSHSIAGLVTQLIVCYDAQRWRFGGGWAGTCRMPSIETWPMFFSQRGCGYGLWGERSHSSGAVFITSGQGHILSTWFMTVNVDLNHLPEVPDVPSTELLFLPSTTPHSHFPYFTLWKEVIMHNLRFLHTKCTFINSPFIRHSSNYWLGPCLQYRQISFIF